jgi:hypothetical protein
MLREGESSARPVALDLTCTLCPVWNCSESARPTIARQGIKPADHGTFGSSLEFGLGVASPTVPGTVPGQTTPNHDLADVRAVQVADSDAAIARPLAVELAPQGVALNQLEHSLGGRGTTRFVALGRSQASETDRHTADHDRVAISNVGDWPGKAAARTRGAPRQRRSRPGCGRSRSLNCQR